MGGVTELEHVACGAAFRRAIALAAPHAPEELGKRAAASDTAGRELPIGGREFARGDVPFTGVEVKRQERAVQLLVDLGRAPVQAIGVLLAVVEEFLEWHRHHVPAAAFEDEAPALLHHIRREVGFGLAVRQLHQWQRRVIAQDKSVLPDQDLEAPISGKTPDFRLIHVSNPVNNCPEEVTSHGTRGGGQTGGKLRLNGPKRTSKLPYTERKAAGQQPGGLDHGRSHLVGRHGGGSLDGHLVFARRGTPPGRV